jgi:hypothetical protein
MKTRAICAVGLVSSTLAMMLAAGVASAGVITTGDIPATNSDEGSGISSDFTYTHALDFGSQGGVDPYSINGVAITQAGISGDVFSGTDGTSGAAWSISGNNQWHAGNDNTRTDGNISKLLRDMYVPFGDPYTLTLSGLTADTQYSTRIYYRPWENNGTRNSILTFNGDGTPLSTGTINQDAGSSAHYVAYDFTASGTSVTVSFSNNSWHLYGATNHVIPEPASFGMLGAAAIALLLRRRFVK